MGVRVIIAAQYENTIPIPSAMTMARTRSGVTYQELFRAVFAEGRDLVDVDTLAFPSLSVGGGCSLPPQMTRM
ncbi:hypothetical protein GCM10009780_13520 [Actinomadura alba]